MTKREAIYLSCLIPSMLVPYEHYPLRHTDYEYEYRNSHIFPRSGCQVHKKVPTGTYGGYCRWQVTIYQ